MLSQMQLPEVSSGANFAWPLCLTMHSLYDSKYDNYCLWYDRNSQDLVQTSPRWLTSATRNEELQAITRVKYGTNCYNMVK